MAIYKVLISVEKGKELDVDVSFIEEEFNCTDDRNAANQAYWIARKAIKKSDCQTSVIMLSKKENEKEILVNPTWVQVVLALKELKDTQRKLNAARKKSKKYFR